MLPFKVIFQARKEEEMRFFSHEGEEFVYLLSGEIEFRTRDQVFIIYAGDSLYFESDISHSFRALGEKEAEALIVVYSGD